MGEKEGGGRLVGMFLIVRVVVRDMQYSTVNSQFFHALAPQPDDHSLDGMLYTLMELTNSITAHIFPALPSEPTLTHTTSTLSNPPPSKDMLAAEILIPPPNPSFPHPYLYVSNRYNPGTEGDTIAIYSLVDKEKPVLINEVHTGLKHVRGMEFGGESGKWLAVGGLLGGGVKVFERIEGGRDLKVVAENETIEAPAGFLWM